MINDDIIKKMFFVGKSNRFTRKYSELLNNNEITEYLTHRYNDSLSLKETIYRIFYNIEIRPVCKICGKQVKFNSGANIYKDKLFTNCCCKLCENKFRHINKTKAIIDKYGVDNVWKSEEIKEKIRNTNYKKYGYYQILSSPEVREKYAQINFERYGVYNGGGSYVALEKIKQHFNTYYGVDNPSQINWVKEKIRNTTYQHYNTYCILHNNKQYENIIKETMYNKYGAYYFSQSSYFIPKLVETSLSKYNTKYPSQNINIINKIKQTNLEKYGYTCYLSTPEMIIKSHTPEVIAKQLETKRINKSFNKSKSEDECYTLIHNKYSDVIRQYKSDLYPFCCDFYIPSLDLYIEFNGSQYHHKHPFDKNNQNDIIELNNLKEKDINSERTKNGKKSQWHNIIYTWIELDVKKRNVAKQNKLNYIEFWNIDEVKQWLYNTK